MKKILPAIDIVIYIVLIGWFAQKYFKNGFKDLIDFIIPFVFSILFIYDLYSSLKKKSEIPKETEIREGRAFNLFCYTDGIIEAKNDFGDFYGSKRLLSLFSSKKSKPKKFIKSVIEDLNEFRGKNLTDDDITLLMTKVINE